MFQLLDIILTSPHFRTTILIAILSFLSSIVAGILCFGDAILFFLFVGLGKTFFPSIVDFSQIVTIDKEGISPPHNHLVDPSKTNDINLMAQRSNVNVVMQQQQTTSSSSDMNDETSNAMIVAAAEFKLLVLLIAVRGLFMNGTMVRLAWSEARWDFLRFCVPSIIFGTVVGSWILDEFGEAEFLHPVLGVVLGGAGVICFVSRALRQREREELERQKQQIQQQQPKNVEEGRAPHQSSEKEQPHEIIVVDDDDQQEMMTIKNKTTHDSNSSKKEKQNLLTSDKEYGGNCSHDDNNDNKNNINSDNNNNNNNNSNNNRSFHIATGTPVMDTLSFGIRQTPMSATSSVMNTSHQRQQQQGQGVEQQQQQLNNTNGPQFPNVTPSSPNHNIFAEALTKAMKSPNTNDNSNNNFASNINIRSSSEMLRPRSSFANGQYYHYNYHDSKMSMRSDNTNNNQADGNESNNIIDDNEFNDDDDRISISTLNQQSNPSELLSAAIKNTPMLSGFLSNNNNNNKNNNQQQQVQINPFTGEEETPLSLLPSLPPPSLQQQQQRETTFANATLQDLDEILMMTPSDITQQQQQYSQKLESTSSTSFLEAPPSNSFLAGAPTSITSNAGGGHFPSPASLPPPVIVDKKIETSIDGVIEQTPVSSVIEQPQNTFQQQQQDISGVEDLLLFPSSPPQNAISSNNDNAEDGTRNTSNNNRDSSSSSRATSPNKGLLVSSSESNDSPHTEPVHHRNEDQQQPSPTGGRLPPRVASTTETEQCFMIDRTNSRNSDDKDATTTTTTIDINTTADQKQQQQLLQTKDEIETQQKLNDPAYIAKAKKWLIVGALISGIGGGVVSVGAIGLVTVVSSLELPKTLARGTLPICWVAFGIARMVYSAAEGDLTLFASIPESISMIIFGMLGATLGNKVGKIFNNDQFLMCVVTMMVVGGLTLGSVPIGIVACVLVAGMIWVGRTFFF